MFYIYIILIVIMLVLIGGAVVAGLVFPAYSLYLSPYLPTQRNLQAITNPLNRSSFEQLQDIFVNKNFSTNSMPIPDNYRHLLNVTIEQGEYVYSNCNAHLEDAKDVLILIQDLKSVVDNKDEITSSLPPVTTVLAGLNATFYPYLDYLPLHIPLVQDTVDFFKAGNYSYDSLHQFVRTHHILTRDVMDLRVSEVVNIVFDPLSLVDPRFIEDMKQIVDEVKRNATFVGTDLVMKSNVVVNRGSAIVSGFFNNEDLGQFEEIPSEFLFTFSLLQSKYAEYRSILTRAAATLPSFVQCLQGEGKKTVGQLKEFVISNYFGYFRVHFFYTLMVLAVVGALIAGLVFLCIQGWRLAKETLEYAKSLLTETSVETMNAINEFGNAVKEWGVCSTKRELHFESVLMWTPVVIHPQLMKKSKILSFRSTSMVIFFATSSRDANPFLDLILTLLPHLQHSWIIVLLIDR